MKHARRSPKAKPGPVAASYTLDWRLALIVVLFAPMPALLAVRAGPEQVRCEKKLLDRWAKIYSRFNEVLSGILIVRSFAMEDAEKECFLRDVGEANRHVPARPSLTRAQRKDQYWHKAGELSCRICRRRSMGARSQCCCNRRSRI